MVTVMYGVLAWVADGSPGIGSDTSYSSPNTATLPSPTRTWLTVAVGEKPSRIFSSVGSSPGVTSRSERTSRLRPSVMRRLPRPSRS
jgi:hypothetical protein